MDHRPRYHPTPLRGWMNDPNGLVHWQGRWHLHYQHNPNAARWGDIHWAHLSSADLVHWRDEPLALAPQPGGPDADGCFSGSIAVVDGRPLLYYSGNRGFEQVQCIAETGAGDAALHGPWRRLPQHTIAEPPPGVGRTDFRDPYVFHDAEHGGWFMVVGASWRSERGQCLLYRSDDGLAWRHVGPLFTAPDLLHGVLWECPNLVRFGERWLLTVSVWPRLGALWFSGRFDGSRFVAEHEGVLDVDGAAFAHLATTAPDGRVLQWPWIDEQRSVERCEADGWAGALGVPRELALDAGGTLRQRPADEVLSLRGAAQPVERSGQARGVVVSTAGRCLDIEATFTLHDRGRVGLDVLATPDGEERTRIVFWPDARRVVIERARSSRDDATRRQDLWAPFIHPDGAPLHWRVLIDHSVLEVFIDGRLCLTTRVYPTRADALHVEAFAEGRADVVLQAWAMGDAMPERPR